MSYQVFSYYSNGYVVETVSNGSQACSSWLLFPAENLWSVGVRAFLYLLTILYLFLGVAISSDIFMSSIEVITSKKRTIVTWDAEKQEKHEREVLIWNETVANLTLMALGSSAPEILLATIETILDLGSQAVADSLGTFTIIGSASYNLFVISSICVVSVSSPEVKYIKQFGVFVMTTVWSIWAYIWMLLVVQFISPGVIEPWEAWLTLIFMPSFVFLSYAQDCGWWCKKCKKSQVDSEEEEESDAIRVFTHQARKGSMTGHAVPGQELHMLEAAHKNKTHQIRVVGLNSNGKNISLPQENDNYAGSVTSAKSPNNVSMFLEDRSLSNHTTDIPSTKLVTNEVVIESDHTDAESIGADDRHATKKFKGETGAFARARFRHAVVSAMTGHKTKRHGSAGKTRMSDVVTVVQGINDVKKKGFMPSYDLYGKFTFSSGVYEVLESKGVLELDVLFHRKIPVNKSANGVQLVNGQAVMISNGIPDVKFKEVSVEYETREGSAKAGSKFKYASGILNFTESEYKRTISIPIIQDKQYTGNADFFVILKNPGNGAGLGDPSVSRISIVDDDAPGEFQFADSHVFGKDGKISVKIIRELGYDGKVTLEYGTHNVTAVGGDNLDDFDYVVIDHSTLEFKNQEKSKTIDIKVNKEAKGSKSFIVTIKNPSVGAKIGKTATVVCHINKESLDDRIADVVADMDEEEDTTWGGQFYSAFTIDVEKDDDGNDIKPKWHVYLLHFLTFFWKVLGACVPPTKYLGAWPSFLFSLLYIGLLTFFIEQMANLLGCVVGLETSVTGITLIAMGTSLPDTFASRTAAKQDEHADAAIGNITGSNSVNVFLGLGLPWVLATMYGVAVGRPYRVASGNLTVSVIIFCTLAVFCIAILVIRRKVVGGELGGKNACVKWLTSFVLFLLWIIYLVLASLRAYNVVTW